MRLDGIHHISCITGNARGNLDFYTRVLGLRLVAKTVNQDDPFIYHLFYADERGSPGSDLTFFEYPGALPGRPGAGMIHRIGFRVGSEAALDFWEERLAGEGTAAVRGEGALRFSDPEGLGLELVDGASDDVPLIARHPQVPAEFALRGFSGVRAYGGRRERTRQYLEEILGATANDDAMSWSIAGPSRHSTISYDNPPALDGRSGAGTVHHIAWATELPDQERWLAHLQQAGVSSTPVIDRHFFRSIYFREPSGVLFELATKGPGFTAEVAEDQLGRDLVLPPLLAGRRTEIEARLMPLPDPRANW